MKTRNNTYNSWNRKGSAVLVPYKKIFVTMSGACLSLYLFGILAYVNNLSSINALERETVSLEEVYANVLINKDEKPTNTEGFAATNEEIIVSENKTAFALNRN